MQPVTLDAPGICTGTFQRHVSLYDVQPPSPSSSTPAPFPQHPPALIHTLNPTTGKATISFVGFRVVQPISTSRSEGAHSGSVGTEMSQLHEPESSSDDDEVDSDSYQRLLFLTNNRRQQHNGSPKTSAMRFAYFLVICDIVLTLYGVLSEQWNRSFSVGVIVGLVMSNTVFVMAMRSERAWALSTATLVLMLNTAVVFYTETPDVLLARLLLVVAEMFVLTRLKSELTATIFFL